MGKFINCEKKKEQKSVSQVSLADLTVLPDWYISILHGELWQLYCKWYDERLYNCIWNEVEYVATIKFCFCDSSNDNRQSPNRKEHVLCTLTN